MTARIERITFPGSQGAELVARLDMPAGFAVLRFDFTGLGKSGGEFANTNFSSNTDDVLAAADWLRETHRAPQVLIGHSLGGAAVLAIAGDIPEAHAVVTIGAPADPEHVTGVFSSSIDEMLMVGLTTVFERFRCSTYPTRPFSKW